MKKLFLKLIFLALSGCSVVGSSKKDMSFYDPNLYKRIGASMGFIGGLVFSRKVLFKSIHKAFKTHPIESPYIRFLAKSALVVGYVVVSRATAEVGGCMADWYEDSKLSTLDRVIKYGWRAARKKNDDAKNNS
jgi:hypothetical protein